MTIIPSARMTRRAGVLLAVLLAAGIVIRLTVEDSIHWISLGYYVMPPAAMALLGMLSAVCFLRSRKFTAFVFMLAVSTVCGVWAWRANVFNAAVKAPPDSVRVLFWNIARSVVGWESVVETVRNESPDVFGFVECVRGGSDADEFWAERFPKYHRTEIQRGAIVFSRFPITAVEWDEMHGTGFCGIVKLDVSGQPARVLIFDLPSHPERPRRATMENLTLLARRFDDLPALLIGDFNTPADSVFLKSLREDHQNAFEVAGDGYYGTWPVPLPLLAIDQVWVNQRATAHSCRLGWCWQSDHRPMIAEVSLNARRAASTERRARQ